MTLMNSTAVPSNRNIILPAKILFLILPGLSLSGCFWLVVGSVAGLTGASYVNGELRVERPHEIEPIKKAAESAFETMNFRLGTTTTGVDKVTLKGRTSANRKVKMTIKIFMAVHPRFASG